MLIKYYKGEPNNYVIRYRNGKVVKHGAGLALWYLPFNTSIAVVPVVSQDALFIFNETTIDFQEVAIQGQFTYRLDDSMEVAKHLDFTIDPKTGKYRRKDPDKLVQRVINAVQAHTRNSISQLSLDQTLTSVKEISGNVLKQVIQEPDLTALGVVVESLYFTSVTATPEMQKALEADYRESLQQRADQAIYARRASAVAEERKIKQSELNTEVELEERRKDLVDLQARNELTLAEAEAKADELKLSPYGNLPPQALIGLALKEWAANAGSIGNLSITPDMLGQVVGWLGNKQS